MKKVIILTQLLIVLLLNGCTVSYKFNGASIDYTKTKTISVADFPNIAESVYPPLASTFTEALKDIYVRQTRLQLVKDGGDLQLEGEITGYTLTPLAISADSYSAETKLTLTVRVRFTNNVNPDDSYEKQYTASQNFSSDQMLTDVQDELITTMVQEITESIYNDTVAKW